MATNFATKRVLRRSDNSKFVFGQGSAPDPVGGAYDAPPDFLVGWGYPLSISQPLDAFAVSTPKLKVWLRLCVDGVAVANPRIEDV